MPYQIDQSGKIEQTSKPTIVTLANGNVKTVKITGVEKRKLIKAMLQLDYPNLNYMQKLFAAMIFVLIKDAKLTEIAIDKEYPGHEADIKNMLLGFFGKFRSAAPEISFVLVSKKVKAHIHGIETYRGNLKPNITVNSRDLLKVIYGKRTK